MLGRRSVSSFELQPQAPFASMEFVPSPDGAGGGWVRAEPQCKTWQRGGFFDPHKPAPRSAASSYQQLLSEVSAKTGVFADVSWDGRKLEQPYVPPWRQTMSDTYGIEMAKKMKEPVESYDARAARFAREEHQRRAGGSRTALKSTVAQ